jgi:hypothetical protein
VTLVVYSGYVAKDQFTFVSFSAENVAKRIAISMLSLYFPLKSNEKFVGEMVVVYTK